MRATFILEFENGLAKNQELWRLVEAYIISRGSQETQGTLSKMARVWAEIMEFQGEKVCVGIASIAHTWFCPVFHCDDERSRQRLVNRLATVIEEHNGGPSAALVHVERDVEEKWKAFLEALGAQKANLYYVPVGPQMSLDSSAVEAT